MTKLIKEIMNKSPKTITPDESIHKAAGLLQRNEISYLPVIDHNKHVIGYVHTSDILKAMCENKDQSTHVKQIMNNSTFALSENASIAEASSQLAKQGLKGAPTVNENNELTGFVHVRDIEEKVPNAKMHLDQIYSSCKKNCRKAA